MHEFLQISQVLDPASCWPLRYPHNPVGPRGVPYRNHRSLQNCAVCKNQCDLETVTIGSVSCLSVLAGGKGLGSALKPVRSMPPILTGKVPRRDRPGSRDTELGRGAQEGVFSTA